MIWDHISLTVEADFEQYFPSSLTYYSSLHVMVQRPKRKSGYWIWIEYIFTLDQTKRTFSSKAYYMGTYKELFMYSKRNKYYFWGTEFWFSSFFFSSSTNVNFGFLCYHLIMEQKDFIYLKKEVFINSLSLQKQVVNSGHSFNYNIYKRNFLKRFLKSSVGKR